MEDQAALPPLTDDFEWTTYAEKMRVVAHWWHMQNGICCICDTQMEPYRGDRRNNPYAATIEHLIAKCDGGPNTVRNVRLAHRLCNNALGTLVTINRDRARQNLPPLTREWALARAREQQQIRDLKDERRIARERGLPIPPIPSVKYPLPRNVPVEQARIAYSTASSAHARNRSPKVSFSLARTRPALPPGATLPGYVAPVDPPVPARSVAPAASAMLENRVKVVKRRPVCSNCGSPDITRDASMKWNGNFWVCAKQHDGYDCMACHSDTVPRWETIS